jgi:aconitate hydratase
VYAWEKDSTYIRKPPFFLGFEKESAAFAEEEISGARCLAIFPDSTTTDHISPAGNIPCDSPAGKYLISRGVAEKNFNSYGSRRANHEVMIRGTFANIRIKNKMNPETEGGITADRDGNIVPIFDAAESWRGTPLIVFAGKEYGTGSSRDWAAKGPLLQGVKAVIAGSFERIHRSNLVGMGILPLEFIGSDSVDLLDIRGKESFTIRGLKEIKPRGELEIEKTPPQGPCSTFKVRVRIDTEHELKFWRSGGILNYVLKGFLE